MTGRADLYSLGVRPLRVPVRPSAVCGSEVHGSARRARARASTAPCRLTRALGPVLSRALAKEPSDRYATAGEFVEEAVAALGGKELPPELDFRTPLVGQGGRPSVGYARHGTRRCTGRGKWPSSPGRGAWVRPVSQPSWPRGSCAGRRGAVRELRRRRHRAAAALAEAGAVTTPVLLVIDDLDAANDELLDAVRHAGRAVRSTSALVLATSRTAFPGAPHRSFSRWTPLRSPSWPGRSRATLPCRFRSMPCSRRPAGVPLRGPRDRRRVAARRGKPPPRGGCAPAAAGRQELRAAQADLTSSVVDLQRALGRVQADSAAAERVCPFKGLASFDVADADAFFGREQIVAELVARLPGATLLGVVGPSGSGKSSHRASGLSAALASGRSPARRTGRRSSSGRESIRSTSSHGRRARTARSSCSSSTSSRRSSRSAATRPSAWSSSTRSPAPRRTRRSSSPSGPILRSLRCSSRAGEPARREPRPRRPDEGGGPAACDRATRSPRRAPHRARPRGRPGRRRRRRAGRVAAALDGAGRALAAPRRSDAAARRVPESGGVRGAVARIAEEAYEGFTPQQRRPRGGSSSGWPAWTETTLFAAALRSRSRARHERGRSPGGDRPHGQPARDRQRGCLEVSHEALLASGRAPGMAGRGRGRSRLHGHVIRAAREWEDAGRDWPSCTGALGSRAALDWAADHDSELNVLDGRPRRESRGERGREPPHRRTNRRLRLLLAGAVVFLVAAVAGGASPYSSPSRRGGSLTGRRAARFAQALAVARAAVVAHDRG